MSASLERLSAAFDRAAAALASVLLAAMVVLIAISVFSRYVLNHPLAWADELGTYLFAWLIFLGATVGVRRDETPALKLIVEHLPGAAGRTVRLAAEWLAFAISLALLWQGALAVHALMSQSSPALQIPAGFPAIIMPLAGFGLALHYAARLAAEPRGRDAGGRFAGAAFERILSPALALAVIVALRFVPSSWADAALLAAIVGGFAIGLPVALVLIGAVIGTLLITGDQPLLIVPETLFTGASNVILMAVPFFMLTGAIMQSGGLAHRLIEFCNTLVGRFRGGLFYVDVLSSALFADISGSAVSDTAAIGSVMLPGMLRRGYDRSFSTALQAASGTLGVLFPPSIATIVYAWVANVSVAEMFMASFLPAILMVVSFCLVAYIVARRRDYPRERSAGVREIGRAFRGAIWALLAPLLIVGSILKGIVTPPEAGMIAALYTLAVSLGVYRTMGVRDLRHSLVEGVLGTARVMFILSAAILLSWLLTILQIPQALSTALLGFSHNPLVLLVLLNVLLVLAHGVLETSATLILIVPLVVGVFTQVGVSPIHLGIVFLMNSALGLLTPPLGLLLYVAAPITGLRVEALARAAVPFLLTILIDLALVVLFPQISTIVPALVRGH